MFVIFDTEYTTWKGCNEKGWHGFQKREVVQIAALKVDEITFEVVEEFSIYIKPKVNPVLSDYFVDLTGLTNEFIDDNGVSFEEAYEKFVSFVSNLDCFSYAWGRPFTNFADGEVVNENLILLGLKSNYNVKYKNVAAWFSDRYSENEVDIKLKNSGAIAKNLGIEKNLEKFNLDEHNAIYDCYSILEGIKFFKGFCFFIV